MRRLVVDAGEAGVGPDAGLGVGDGCAFGTEEGDSFVEIFDFDADGEEAFAAFPDLFNEMNCTFR